MSIRKAESGDLSRIAEIYVFNNRINYFLINALQDLNRYMKKRGNMMPTITYNNIIEPDSSTGAASALKGLSIPHQLSTYVTN